MSCGNSKKSHDIRKSSHRSKRILIINPILLSKTPGNKASLVAINSAIRSSLDLIKPMNLPLFHPLLMSLVTLILPKKFRTYLLLGMLDRVMLATSSSHAKSSYLMGTAKCMRVRRTSRIHSWGSISGHIDDWCGKLVRCMRRNISNRRGRLRQRGGRLLRKKVKERIDRGNKGQLWFSPEKKKKKTSYTVTNGGVRRKNKLYGGYNS